MQVHPKIELPQVEVATGENEILTELLRETSLAYVEKSK